MEDKIVIRGAKEHNLKNVSLELPRNKFIVFTGLSGSGKSSLAFDTIYAEVIIKINDYFCSPNKTGPRMNVTVSHIRSALQECYPPREARCV